MDLRHHSQLSIKPRPSVSTANHTALPYPAGVLSRQQPQQRVFLWRTQLTIIDHDDQAFSKEGTSAASAGSSPSNPQWAICSGKTMRCINAPSK